MGRDREPSAPPSGDRRAGKMDRRIDRQVTCPHPSCRRTARDMFAAPGRRRSRRRALGTTRTTGWQAATAGIAVLTTGAAIKKNNGPKASKPPVWPRRGEQRQGRKRGFA